MASAYDSTELCKKSQVVFDGTSIVGLGFSDRLLDVSLLILCVEFVFWPNKHSDTTVIQTGVTIFGIADWCQVLLPVSCRRHEVL